MSDDWCDRVERQVDRLMDTAINILLFVAAAGLILLAIVQGLKVSGFWSLVSG